MGWSSAGGRFWGRFKWMSLTLLFGGVLSGGALWGGAVQVGNWAFSWAFSWGVSGRFLGFLGGVLRKLVGMIRAVQGLESGQGAQCSCVGWSSAGGWLTSFPVFSGNWLGSSGRVKGVRAG